MFFSNDSYLHSEYSPWLAFELHLNLDGSCIFQLFFADVLAAGNSLIIGLNIWNVDQRNRKRENGEKRGISLYTERCVTYTILGMCVAFTSPSESIFRVECLYMGEYYSNFYRRSKFIDTTFLKLRIWQN